MSERSNLYNSLPIALSTDNAWNFSEFHSYSLIQINPTHYKLPMKVEADEDRQYRWAGELHHENIWVNEVKIKDRFLTHLRVPAKPEYELQGLAQLLQP